jgi:hypothetical protein
MAQPLDITVIRGALEEVAGVDAAPVGERQ